MKHISLEAWPRQTNRTSGAIKVRAEGFIPSILLGHHEASVPLKVKSGDMTRVLRQGGPNALVDLTVEGQSTFAMVREFTRHPVSRHIIHIEFQRVAADEAIEAAVAVLITGEPSTEYADYVVTQELASIHVKSLPDNLPNHIEIDAKSLTPGHPLHASDLKLPEGVELAQDASQVVVVLSPPTVRREAAEEEAGLADEGVEEAPAEE